MNRQRTTDNGQRTFLDTELVEVPKRTCAFDKLRHRSLPVAHCSLLIAIIFILCSCSTNKSTSNLRTLSANHIIREVEDNRFEFDNLDTKFNVRLEGNNIGLKGQLKMQNDSVIWVSLSLKLGIEVARVMITEDSVKLINRTNKTYFSESIESFRDSGVREFGNSEIWEFGNLGILDFLQDLLVGNDVLLSKNDKFKVTIDDNSYKLESDRNTFWITPKTFKVKSCQLSAVSYQQSAISYQQSTVNGQRSTVSVSYDNFQYVNGNLLPTKIILNANEDFDIKLEIDYSEVKVGERLEFPFNISKKFNKIKL